MKSLMFVIANAVKQSRLTKLDCFAALSLHELVKEQPKIRLCERSEAISSFKARLLRCARKDEVHGFWAATL